MPQMKPGEQVLVDWMRSSPFLPSRASVVVYGEDRDEEFRAFRMLGLYPDGPVVRRYGHEAQIEGVRSIEQAVGECELPYDDSSLASVSPLAPDEIWGVCEFYARRYGLPVACYAQCYYTSDRMPVDRLFFALPLVPSMALGRLRSLILG